MAALVAASGRTDLWRPTEKAVLRTVSRKQPAAKGSPSISQVGGGTEGVEMQWGKGGMDWMGWMGWMG